MRTSISDDISLHHLWRIQYRINGGMLTAFKHPRRHCCQGIHKGFSFRPTYESCVPQLVGSPSTEAHYPQNSSIRQQVYPSTNGRPPIHESQPPAEIPEALGEDVGGTVSTRTDGYGSGMMRTRTGLEIYGYTQPQDGEHPTA